MEKTVDDRDLVQRTLRGDRAAYRALIERYRNAVFGLVVSFVGDFDQAEDLAQEAFIRGYYRLHTLADGERFGGWLRTIAANLCRMELRRRQALPLEAPDCDPDGIAGPAPAPDEARERDEAHRQVLAALEGLPQKEREAVTLYYLDGRRVEAVGRFLGISPGAVKARLHRARQRLRKEMVDMAKKTLSQKRLKPAFADRVEIRGFGDLARLTDEELKALAGSGRNFNLAYSLASDDPEAVALRERVLDVLPEEDRAYFEVNLAHCDPFQGYRMRVVEEARQLQKAGAIRPAPARSESLPEGEVKVERFEDVVRLTDVEIQWMLREVDTVDMAAALKEEGREIAQVRERIRSNVSGRVWGFIDVLHRYEKVSKAQAEAARKGILEVIHRLQRAGKIRPAEKGQAPAERIDVRSFGDWAKLTDREIQMTLRETHTKTLAVALKGKGKGVREVEKRVMANMSQRVQGIVREDRDTLPASRAEIEACQQEILDSVKRLQVLGRIRPPSRRPTGRQYERVVAGAARDQIERARHAGRWTPWSYRDLMPYLSMVVRDEGFEGAKAAFEGVQDPVLERGLRLLQEGAEREEMVRQLRQAADRELRRIGQEYEGLITGMAAARGGEDPRDIGGLWAE